MNKSHLNNYDNIQVICEKLAERLEELILTLELDLTDTNRMYYSSCCIHGGDKANALNLYKEYGNWKCRTHQCEKIFKATIVGFIRGVLSHKKYGWSKSGDKIVSFNDTLKWISDFLNEDVNNLSISKEQIEKRKFSSAVNQHIKKQQTNTLISRKDVRSHLEIPAKYYINRGFSPEILEAYDVGYCSAADKEMTSRAVCPVYDNSGTWMIGCTGRIVYEACPKCKLHHNPDWSECPTYNFDYFSKWKHSKSLDADNTLYNFWKAKDVIKATGVAIIVESPGNVWRLEENGIHNSVGLFSCSLKPGQRAILDGSGAMSLIVLLDNDEAGLIGATQIKNECSSAYRLFFPSIKRGDVAEMSRDEITSDIKPILDKVLSCYKECK